MKKIFTTAFIALTMAVSSSAFAAGEYVGGTLGTSRTDGTTGYASNGSLLVGKEIGQYDFSLKAGVGRDTDSTTSTTTNFAEVRGAYNFADVGAAGLKPWVRATIGSEFGLGFARSYYAVEPGLGYAFTPSLRGDVSLKRVEYFNRDNVGRTEANLMGTYAVNKNNDVTLRYTRTMSGRDSNGYEIGVVHRF